MTIPKVKILHHLKWTIARVLFVAVGLLIIRGLILAVDEVQDNEPQRVDVYVHTP